MSVLFLCLINIFYICGMEAWKKIPGYEYEASNLGAIRRLPKPYVFYEGIKQGVILKSSNNGGYRQVVIQSNGPKTIKVHRLVALAWLPNPLNKETVNHKNGIKHDNRVENLEWATRSENTKHKYIIGLQSNKGENHPCHKLTNADVLVIRKNKNKLKCIADMYGVSSSVIWSIKNNRTWKHL